MVVLVEEPEVGDGDRLQQPLRPLEHYGAAFAPADRARIPDFDLPAGTPEWMRGLSEWASRGAGDPNEPRRAGITVTVPVKDRAWLAQ